MSASLILIAYKLKRFPKFGTEWAGQSDIQCSRFSHSTDLDVGEICEHLLSADEQREWRQQKHVLTSERIE